MTAEVALLNRVAVALAADSAVTLGAAEKVYTSAEKLFQLSEHAPVGVMIYGNASLSEVPWETLIKMYRGQLGRRRFGRLEQYARDFVQYIRDNAQLFEETAQEQTATFLILEGLSAIKEGTDRRLRSLLEAGATVTETETRTALEEALVEAQAIAKQWPKLENVSAGLKRKLKDLYGDLLEVWRNEALGTIPRSKIVEARIDDFVFNSMIRKRFSSLESGLVVAGFGEEEQYPALVRVSMTGVMADTLFCRFEEIRSVNTGSPAWILPFAQQEMVYTFMEGVDPYLRQIMEESTSRLFAGTIAAIVARVGEKDPALADQLREELVPELEMSQEELFTQWAATRKQSFAQPVASVVGVLPKDELAAMAEALVNLTKFKRRVSREAETVGGPIDVAVITKGDGFIWIQRKHYFSAKLNPRFFARLAGRGDDHGENEAS